MEAVAAARAAVERKKSEYLMDIVSNENEGKMWQVVSWQGVKVGMREGCYGVCFV